MREARRRIEAANNVTFADYVERIALPLWTQTGAQGHAKLKEFARRGSLAAIGERLRGNSRVYVAHNFDDPLTARPSILELKKTLGDHMVVFPHGGHLGNLWYPDNKELVRRILAGPAGHAGKRLDADARAARLGRSSVPSNGRCYDKNVKDIVDTVLLRRR